MGKVYSPPSSIEKPQFSIDDLPGYFKAEEEYVKKVQDWAKENGDSEGLSGEIIRFQVADGYAQYVVWKLKPVTLIHLPVGDAWQFPYANLLTVKDVKQQVQHEKALANIFK